jgi:hypothetical protein
LPSFARGGNCRFAGNWSKLKAPSSFAPYTTQSPRPSRCHLSTSCCSGGQTVESPNRRRRRPLARNTRTIYLAKCFKCGWDCLFLNESAPYASIHPLLYTLIAPLHRNHGPNGNWTLNLSLAGRWNALRLSSRHTPSRTRTTVRWSHNHRCRRHLLPPNFVLLSAF